MASFTIGTPSTMASYDTVGVQCALVSTDLVAAVWYRDSDDNMVCSVYENSSGTWTYKSGITPVFTGDSWFATYCTPDVCKIDTDRILALYYDGSQWIRTRLIDTLASSITDRGSQHYDVAASWGAIDQVATDKAVLAYKNTTTSTLYARVATVAGNVQSKGTAKEMVAKDCSDVDLAVISSNKFAIVYNNDTDGTTDVVIGTVSGTTITAGSPVVIPGVANIQYPNIMALDDDKFVVTYRNSSNKGDCVAVTVSGTTPTIGTPVEFQGTAVTNPSTVKIDNDEFMTAYSEGGTSGQIIRGSINWTTRVPTFNAAYEWTSNNISGAGERGLDFIYVDVNLGACVFQDEDDGSYAKIISIESLLASPMNVSAVAGSQQGNIDISWDSVAGAVSYNIYWGLSTGVTKITGTKIAGVTSPYTHVGLDLDQEYFYIITAEDGLNESDDSSESSSYPLDSGSILSAGGGDSSINLTWGDVDGASQYDLYYGLESGVTTVTGTKIENVTSVYEHLGVEHDYVYYYICVATVNSVEYTSNEAYATPQFDGKIFTHNADMLARFLYQYQKD